MKRLLHMFTGHCVWHLYVKSGRIESASCEVCGRTIKSIEA